MKRPYRNVSQTSIIKMRELHPIPLKTFNFNWMKKLFIIGVFMLGILSAFSQTKNTSRLSPDEFVIMPWDWPANDSATLKDIYDCGFNMAGFVSTDALDAVTQAGLKAFVSDNSIRVARNGSELSDEEINKRVSAIAMKTVQNPTVFGYYMIDEPGASMFPYLKKWKDAWSKNAPNALAYINLFPNYANFEEQLNAENYEDYLEKYVATVKPDFISYDNYSIQSDLTVHEDYYKNLAAVRDIALKNDIPFWNIVASMKFFDYAKPTYSSLCFGLYTTLAYGGKGITYFKYLNPTTGDFRFAPVDPFGNKTPTWSLLQNVNLQMHAIGKVYSKLKSIHVFHYTDSDRHSHGLESSNFIASIESGEDLLVGEFEDEAKKPYVIIVNKSLTKSQYLQLTFKEPGTVYQINNYTGTAHSFTGESCWLAPGQGRILYVQK